MVPRDSSNYIDDWDGRNKEIDYSAGKYYSDYKKDILKKRKQRARYKELLQEYMDNKIYIKKLMGSSKPKILPKIESIPLNRVNYTESSRSTHFNEKVAHIKSSKVIAPILVYKGKNGNFTLIDGFSRLIAAKELNLEKINAIIYQGIF